MKISVDDKEILTLSEVQKLIIKDYVNEDEFEADMARRIKWVLGEIYKEAFKKLKAEWEPKLLANGIKMIPTDFDEYAKIVFSQPDYMSRKQRDLQK